MTQLADIPQTICAQIAHILPHLRHLKPHAGKFSLEALKKTGLPSPSVLVSVLGARQDVTHGAAHSFMLQMAAYVVTRDGLGAPRDQAAAHICQALLTHLPTWHLGNGVGQVRNVALHTLISEKSQDHAVSLWAVTFDLPISFFAPMTAPLGLELYVAGAMIGGPHEL